jgi:tetratricopeptide (TPR) repeat protein
MTRLFSFFLILTFLTACSPGVDKSTQSSKAKGNEMSEAQRMVLTSTYIDAIRERSLGNIFESGKLLTQCLNMDPENHAVLYELSMTCRAQGNPSGALPLVEKSVSLSPDNIWYLSMLAENYMELNQLDKGQKTFERIKVLEPERLDTYYELSMVKYSRGDLDGAVKELEQLEKKAGFSEELFQQKHLLYTQAGKIDKAEQELLKAIETNPKEALYYGMLAELYDNKGDHEMALSYYQKILEFDPENGRVHLALYDHYVAIDNEAKAKESLMLGFEDERIEIDSKMGILLNFYELSETDSALKELSYELCKKMLEVYPQEAKTHAVYGDFLMRDERYPEARETFLEAVHRDASKQIIWTQILAIDTYIQDYKSMKLDSEEAMELFPASPDFYLLNGIAVNQLGSHAEAVDILEAGRSLVIDNDAILADFYSNLGDAYHQLGQSIDSDKAFEKALSITPDNVYLLNNYSYYLSLRKEKLTKAKEMALKANLLMPNSASFQDTYAWVLYEAKEYSEALIWIEKALSSGGAESGIIIEHHGDILYRLGQESQANDSWNRAKAFPDVSQFLDKKIASGKLVE